MNSYFMIKISVLLTSIMDFVINILSLTDYFETTHDLFSQRLEII